jgi:regulatory protein YycI of two-component signal transduction system YycFG
MDWSRTKTIFIITFLGLNLFLGYQLNEKQERGNINIMLEVTLPERLEDNRIEIEIDDADETIEGAPITGTARSFQEDFLEENLVRQKSFLLNETTLQSELDKPYILVGANLTASVGAFLHQYVYEGEQYEIAEYNEEEQYIGLYQTYKGRKIDQYERGNFHLVLHISDDFEVESYVQSHMIISEQAGREQELLSPLKAIGRLLDEHQIRQETTINEAELGYYSKIQLEANFQVYAPVWRIKANGEYFFVDALNGEVQSIS